jgi:hypothetical protein
LLSVELDVLCPNCKSHSEQQCSLLSAATSPGCCPAGA